MTELAEKAAAEPQTPSRPRDVIARGMTRRAFAKGAAASVAASALVGPSVSDAVAAPEPRHPPGGLPDVPLYDLEISEAAPFLRDGSLSPVDLVDAFLERIAAVDPKVLAFVHQYPVEEVRAAALAAEREIRRGRYRGPLHGVPVGVKDIYFTAGKPTEGNSRLYTGFVPDFDATAVTRLKEAGAIILGKMGTSELATSTVSPANNPWDLRRTPSGSSSGSAAGCAASMFMVGMGTCTGGSIRGPASNCGLSGFKPTYGTISAYGVFPLSWTMDHVGELCHSALDCALVTELLAGPDVNDPLARQQSTYRLSKPLLEMSRRKPLRGVRVGVPAPGTFFLGVPNDDELVAFAAAVDVIRSLGATVKEVAPTVLLPGLTSVSSFYDIIRSVEVGAYQMEKLKTVPTLMSADYRNKVAAGVLAPGHAYAQAQRVRRLWREQFLSVFDEVDALIHPADNIAGFKPPLTDPPRPRPSSGSKTNIWNISGAPAIAIPTGLSGAEKMPLSMQSAAMTGNDATALLVAHAFQTATGFHKLRPDL
jgi:aspartyl-tRNA(Asn)/glutamyl-tRNA(Gln) amidotransferase subunit A